MLQALKSPLYADPTPMAADDTYDVYAVLDIVPEVVRTLCPGDSRFIALSLAFIGVGSAAIGASRDLPVA